MYPASQPQYGLAPPSGLELRNGHSLHDHPSLTGRASFGVPSRPQNSVVVVDHVVLVVVEVLVLVEVLDVVDVFDDVDVFEAVKHLRMLFSGAPAPFPS